MRAKFLTLLLLFLPVSAQALPAIGKPAPDFTAAAIDGSQVTLSHLQGHTVVLEWTNPGCPFVHKHYDSGNMQKLQTYAALQGVQWISINSSAPGREGNLTPGDAKAYLASAKAVPAHYILDADGKIGKLYGAKSTPHMFVIDPQGTIAYMGAIDDKPTPDSASLKDAHNYVQAAIDSIKAGKAVDVPSTQSYGCSVKYAE